MIHNYFTFFCRVTSPLDSYDYVSDYVYDTCRPNDDEATIDDTCFLEKIVFEGDKFVYRISSQSGIFYSNILEVDYFLESMQKDIRMKYINMFNLVKLLANEQNKKRSQSLG